LVRKKEMEKKLEKEKVNVSINRSLHTWYIVTGRPALHYVGKGTCDKRELWESVGPNNSALQGVVCCARTLGPGYRALPADQWMLARHLFSTRPVLVLLFQR
jgi:hypothetical protein